MTWFHIRRLLKPFDLQTLLFVFVFITVLFLVLYPIILIVMNSFQSAPPGRPRVLALDGWRAALSEPGMRGSIYNTLTLLLTRQVIAFPVAILVSISLPPRAPSVISRFWRPIEAEHWRCCNWISWSAANMKTPQRSPLSWLS